MLFRSIHERLQETRQLVQEVITATRELSATLRPGELRGLGLEAAIEEHVREFERRSGIEVRFSYALHELAIAPETATNIYRIIQEALTNVARYAEATEVGVSLDQHNNDFTVLVTDNGKGFAVSRVTDPHAVGLIGMQERAHLIGGKLVIHSTPGVGTTVSVVVPFVSKETVV